jgi:hypothetical protein
MKSLPWLVLIAWGAFLYYGHQRASHLTTTCTSLSELPPNHQFVPGDLKCTPPGYEVYFVGMYASDRIEKDATITRTAAARAPTVSTQEGGVIVEVQAAPRPSSDVDAGSDVDVRAAATNARARVIALVCPAPGTSCGALLAVPRESAKNIQPGGTYEIVRAKTGSK